MLHNGPGGAVHHLIVLGVLQQDPHDGGGGDIGEQPIRHRLIAGGVHQVPAEARTVVVIGGDKPLALELFVQVDRRPGRQISSLGVSADAQGTPGAGPGHGPGILRGLHLGGDGGKEAHVEVLLPAHNGHVRAPVGGVYAAVRQQEGHGGKLHLPVLVVEALKGEQGHLPEPGRLRRLAHQRDVVQGGQAQLLVLLRQQAAHVSHGHGVLRVEAAQPGDVLQLDIGNDAQEQVVHLVEPVLGKGQVAPPPEVVGHGGAGFRLVRHGGYLLVLNVIAGSCTARRCCGLPGPRSDPGRDTRRSGCPG